MQSNPKTRLQALLEVLPNIERDDDGYPWFCVEVYDKAQDTQNHYDCSQGCEECKKRFWEEIVCGNSSEHGILLINQNLIIENQKGLFENQQVLCDALNHITNQLIELQDCSVQKRKRKHSKT